MPLHRIYAPAGLFSAEDKKGLAEDITERYTKTGLPAFYVVVLFLDLDADSIYVGGLNHEERKAKNGGKPFVRVVSQHLARTQVAHKMRLAVTQGVNAALKRHIVDKGYEYEFHIEEPPADMWLLNGVIPPAPGTEAEARWREIDRAEPYEGPNIADHFSKEYGARVEQ